MAEKKVVITVRGDNDLTVEKRYGDDFRMMDVGFAKKCTNQDVLKVTAEMINEWLQKK